VITGLRQGPDVVGFVEVFDGFCPCRKVEVTVVVECDRFLVYVHVGLLNGRKVLAHVFDEGCTGCAVDAGDGNNSFYG